MLKQNDTIKYVAQGYSNAETVGAVDDTTVFVPFLIEGEEALVRVNYAKRGVAYADAVQLLRASDLRQNPPCPIFGVCGGCSLMHMQYSEQLVFKRNKVEQNLRKIAGYDGKVLPCMPSDEILGYRNKLSLPVRGSVGNVKIGLYKKGSHDVVEVNDCLLGGDWCKTLTGLFAQFANDQKLIPYNEQTFSGQIRHLVARYVDGQLLVTVVTNCNQKIDFAPFVDLLQRHFPHFGLFQNINCHKNNVILGNETHHVFGLRHIESEHLGVKFRLAADSFFQVNDGVKNAVYGKVRELLDVSRTEVLIDCFSGVGILTNVLANIRYLTYGVEIVSSAVSDANDNAALNGAENVFNICGDANVELPKLARKYRGKTMSLVVDPPRKGLGEKICQTVADAAFDNIVYISCDSATLARDLKILSKFYLIDYVQPWDMFPQTAEVETLVHLKRKN
ncbi:MAG: 23S rRNA (uracil(1939)-C(5))-methyltransferase RlmD [Corallococcus sp.]|nr:23S rRNA (uracil(1939)-C(5))-methyltransferase RlmD [Corallococcus sp.]MCM1358968.1 23S rRNA (uracil(1939)-C(5))-methyltransferase RlmD [Corallococcus sp.]MCM1394957.1 23S rRNA (uracil(1939)-C(5))-methyltransferase RlmD [Corallococcus sp.]